MEHKKRSCGFSIIEALIVVVVIAGLALGGWLVWRHTHQAKKPAVPTTSKTESQATKQAPVNQPTDPYTGWRTYNSSTYGIGFRYPEVWTLDEGPAGAVSSSTKQEYAINLKRNENVKYNETASIEVLNEDLAAATAWYDNYFAQSASNKIDKTSNQLKGKQSVQYDVTNASTATRLYLFQVKGKTYVFTSINEELNTQTDPNYWISFNKVFESLQIT